jgi:hypothetical protein
MNYNTDINIIGSIPDYHLICKALPLLINDTDNLKKSLVTDNEFGFRTEKSRKRFLSVLNSAFVNHNKDINKLAANLIEHLSYDEKSQSLVLFWLFSLNNQLFYELNRDLFLKYYFQGRAQLPKDDIVAYLKDLISRNNELKGKWSEETILTIASKYLTVLKKLHLLEGTQKKSFCHIGISDELLAVFVHFYDLIDMSNPIILKDDFLNFSFISKESLLERFKKIGKKDWIKMNYSGNRIVLEGAYKNNTIIDGIFR